MEIARIKGDTVFFLYHPGIAQAEVGEQFAVVELPTKRNGLVVQIIENETLEYEGLIQEMVQTLLERRFSQTEVLLGREQGMGEIKSLKVARGKIRKRIVDGDWLPWDGWIPARNVCVSPIRPEELLGHVLQAPQVPLNPFIHLAQQPVSLDGMRLDMINVIAGMKGSGKSHLGKHIILSLAELGVPVVVFDLNQEYVRLPGAQPLRWRDNFRLRLSEVGWPLLATVMRALYPFQAGSPSEAVWENTLPRFFKERKQACARKGGPYTIDLDYLRGLQWTQQSFVQDAIQDRLQMLDDMLLFEAETTTRTHGSTMDELYERASEGSPLVFDLADLSDSLRAALVKAVLQAVEGCCENETRDGRRRYPFVIFDEAHLYVRDDAILNLITRGRHLGMASVFITNTPQRLPEAVFRQLDNLFILSLSHQADIKAVSQSSFTDAETIECFASRMPPHHSLVIGNVTNSYPLVVKVDPLPAHVPASGQTKSTWGRLLHTLPANGNRQ